MPQALRFPPGVSVHVITIIQGKSPLTSPAPYMVTAFTDHAADFAVACATFEEAQAVAVALASQRGAVSHE